MKTIFSIHPLTYITILITFLTGYFKETITLMIVILVHEFGHILMAVILKWKIEKIVILPLGGITIFNELVNKPLIEEFLIMLSGPIFQIIFTIIFKQPSLYFYSKIILFINLLPIYPLDGSKILNIFFNKLFSFKLSHILTIYVSYFVAFFSFFLSIFKINLTYLIFTLLLILKLKREFDNHELLFNKFLFERYLYNFKFKKIKIVSKLEKFKKDYYHYLKLDSKVISEKEILCKKYHHHNM